MFFLANIIILLFLLSFKENYVSSIEDVNITKQHYNTRCICRCKGNRIYPSNSIYIVSPFPTKSNCTCPNVVLPKTDLEVGQSALYCLNCNCKYEIRSLIKIQISVAIVIVVISCLFMYGCCLVLLQPLIKNPHSIEKNTYSSVHVQEPSGDSTSYETFGVYDSLGVHTNDAISTSPLSKLICDDKLKKVINMQTRWKEQLEIQRRKIYSSASFLKE